MLSTTTKGTIGQLRVTLDLLQQGFAVLNPEGGNPHYDLVLELDGIFKRVQVKYTREKRGKIDVRLYTTGHKGKGNLHTSRDVDIVAVFDATNSKVYYLTRSEFEDNKTGISLRIKDPSNNYVKGVKFARDFEKLRI